MPLKRLLGNSLHQEATSVRSLRQQSCGTAQGRAGRRLLGWGWVLLAESVCVPPLPHGPSSRLSTLLGARFQLISDGESSVSPVRHLLPGWPHPAPGILAPVRRSLGVQGEPRPCHALGRGRGRWSPAGRWPAGTVLAQSCPGGLPRVHTLLVCTVLHTLRARTLCMRAHPACAHTLHARTPCMRAHPACVHTLHDSHACTPCNLHALHVCTPHTRIGTRAPPHALSPRTPTAAPPCPLRAFPRARRCAARPLAPGAFCSAWHCPSCLGK